MQLWSEMGDCIEFYFTAGNNADQVIANYRQLTRVEPLLPRWAFGYWQSKERYKTQQETKNIAQRYRKERIPIDVIVQDWEWWEPGKWN